MLEAEEEEKNVQATLKKLPAKHRALVSGFNVKFTGGNTLHGDDDHIGVIDDDEITVAAPWHYGREFTFLHEIAHMVHEKLLSEKWRTEWANVVKKNPNRQKQNAEELFCMAYACHFAKHKIHVHYHPAWEKFMNRFCNATGK